jgi:hypothetical protein
MSSIAENIQKVRERIAAAEKRAGRNAGAVTLIAVTKTVGTELIREAVEAGVSAVGENRVQEAIKKRSTLDGLAVEWHLVGHLQTNKVRAAVPLFDRVDSVDSVRVARALSDEAVRTGRTIRCLIEVNAGGEASKFGVPPDGAEALLSEAAVLPGLAVEGLMTVAPPADDPEKVRPVFRTIASLRGELERRLGLRLPALSMGMTDDLETAIEEGSTEVRVGRAVFGGRV